MAPRRKRFTATISFIIYLQKSLVINRKICLFLSAKKPNSEPKRSVEGLWDIFNNSEFEDSDDSSGVDDNVEFQFESHKRIRVGNQVLTPQEEQFVEDISETEDCEEIADSMNAKLSEAKIGLEEWKWTAKTDIKWRLGGIRKPNFELEQISNDDFLPDDSFSPASYFYKYVPESMFDEMVKYTNLYAAQQQTKKWRPTNKREIKQFVGLQIMMGNLKLPRIEMYYGKDLRFKLFTDHIPLYRFHLLRTNFHLIDVLSIPSDNKDKFIRVRPLLNSVRQRCLELPLEEFLSVDEQMIPMRGKVAKGVKQYIKQNRKSSGE